MPYSLVYVLLVCIAVLLSGCGGSIEMCADQKFKSSKLSATHDRCSSYMTQKQKNMSISERIFREVENPRSFYSKKYYDCAYKENIKDREIFLSQSLKNKLASNGYEFSYSSCETMKRINPETFDAKY